MCNGGWGDAFNLTSQCIKVQLVYYSPWIAGISGIIFLLKARPYRGYSGAGGAGSHNKRSKGRKKIGIILGVIALGVIGFFIFQNHTAQTPQNIIASTRNTIQQIPQILSSFSGDLIPIVGIVGAIAIGIITYFALTRRKRKSYSYEKLEQIKRNEKEEIEKAKKLERERQREKEKQRGREKARENERYEKKPNYSDESSAELEKKQQEREAEKDREKRVYEDFKKKEEERKEKEEKKRVQEPPKQYGFDPYVILGVQRNVTSEELKRKFRELMIKNNLSGSINMSIEARQKKEAVIKDFLKARDMISKEKGFGN